VGISADIGILNRILVEISVVFLKNFVKMLFINIKIISHRKNINELEVLELSFI